MADNKVTPSQLPHNPEERVNRGLSQTHQRTHSNLQTSISINTQMDGASVSRSLSRMLQSGGVATFADALEMEVVNRLSKSQLMAEDVIEIVKQRDVSQFEHAKETVEQVHPTSGKSHFAQAEIPKIMDEFGLHDLQQGLSLEQVALNRQLYGRNVLVASKSDPLWKIYISQFYSFVVVLLLTAAIVTLFLGNIVEGVFIIFIVNVNACMASYMEKSAANALEKLAALSSPICTVIRGGCMLTLDTKEVVPGDVIILKMGDTVAADVRLFDIREIRLNEALLTGESVAVKKTLQAVDMDSPFSSNLCFASTSVTSGSGRGIVVNTGMDTQVGKIAAQLKKVSEGNKTTPLQRGINRLGGRIGIISAIVLVTIVIVVSLTGYQDPTRPETNRILSIVLLAVGFAVSSIPEGLPMVVTIALSLGARDMASKNANIRKLPAVETLGCCSIICSDKTGTLTEGKMTATTIVTFRSHEDKEDNIDYREHRFYPTLGFNPVGAVFEPQDLTEEYMQYIIDHVAEAHNMDHVAKNVVARGSKSPDAHHIKTTLLTAYLNSYATKIEKSEKNNKWSTVGNMTEGPLVVAAAKCGIGAVVNPRDTTDSDYPRLDNLEVPFNSSRKMMCTVNKLKVPNQYGSLDLSSNMGLDYTHVATIKGAPDMLFDFCRLVTKVKGTKYVVDWDTLVNGFTPKCLAAVREANSILSERALRVLLIGIFPLTDQNVEELKLCEDSDSRLDYLLGTRVTLKAPLILLGFVGSLDPPRHGVREAIETCVRAGIRVIMITGDQQATAAAIARDIGLFDQPTCVNAVAIECKYLHVNSDHSNPYLPDHKVDDYTAKACVFCRAQPEDKVAIIESLRRQNHLTAMTGDGVNDAPALKCADIGIAMGINGTDVAKGASEMVLLDDNFCTIVGAVESGRTIYANIQKFVSFLLGTNIGEILYLTTAIAISTLPPVDALQILFLNFMTDGCPAVALSKEPADSDVMSKEPRPPGDPIMTRDWWIYGNLPHTIFEAASVLCSIMAALYLCTGVVKLGDLRDQCKYVKLRDTSGGISEYSYFCRSYEYRISKDYIGWVTNINYYDPLENQMMTVLGAYKGKVENPTPLMEGLAPEVANVFKNIQPYQISTLLQRDEYGWFKSSDDVILSVHKDKRKDTVGASPHGFYEINGRKAMQARTISFITAVWCEMLRAYTVRSWDYFFKVFNRNPWMHVACSISATLTFLVTTIPGLSRIMHIVSLEWWQYLMAIGIALASAVLDELIAKSLYRYKKLK